MDEHRARCHEASVIAARAESKQQALISAGDEGLEATAARARAARDLEMDGMPVSRRKVGASNFVGNFLWDTTYGDSHDLLQLT
jgi:hypothetical protein